MKKKKKHGDILRLTLPESGMKIVGKKRLGTELMAAVSFI